MRGRVGRHHSLWLEEPRLHTDRGKGFHRLVIPIQLYYRMCDRAVMLIILGLFSKHCVKLVMTYTRHEMMFCGVGSSRSLHALKRVCFEGRIHTWLLQGVTVVDVNLLNNHKLVLISTLFHHVSLHTGWAISNEYNIIVSCNKFYPAIIKSRKSSQKLILRNVFSADIWFIRVFYFLFTELEVLLPGVNGRGHWNTKDNF